MNIGESIRYIRRELDISQAHLAEQAGITQSYLSQIESGHKRPGWKVMERICLTQDVPLPVFIFLALTIDDVPENKRELFIKLRPTIAYLIKLIYFDEKD